MNNRNYTASSVYAVQLKHYIEHSLVIPKESQATDAYRPLLEELGDMSRASDRVTLNSLFRVIESLLVDAHIPSLGLLVGEKIHPADFGILAHALMHCDSLKQALHLSAEYLPLLNEGFSAEVIPQTILRDTLSTTGSQASAMGVSSFRLTSHINASLMIHLIEMEFVAVIKMGKFLAGYRHDEIVRPIRVLFQHVPQAPIDVYEKIFECDVAFNQAHNEVWIEDDILDIKVHSANNHMFKFFQTQLKRIYAQLPLQRSGIERRFSTAVYGFVSDAILNAGERNFQFPSIDETAKQLHISISALKKYLQAEKTNFTALANEARKKTAISLLIGNMNIKEISRRLGFSSSSSFIKAFRRWTGKSPSQYRQEKPLETKETSDT